MTLPLLLAMLLLALWLGRIGRRRLSWTGYALAVVLFLLAGCGLLPKLLLRALQAPYAHRPVPAWAASNVIVLLTAGDTHAPHGPIEPGMSAYGRIVQAVLLYRQCELAQVRCTVLVSGGDALHVHVPLAVTYAHTLQALGVPASDMLLETRSLNTWQNAQFARPLLARIDAQRVWLVTSGYHMARAMLCFERFGIRANPVRADYARPLWSVLPSAANLELTDAALHEYVGIAVYRVLDGLGWRSYPLPAGSSSG